MKYAIDLEDVDFHELNIGKLIQLFEVHELILT